MTFENVVRDIQWLYGKLSARDQKYLRNYNRFLSNGLRREGIRQVYTTPSAFFNAQTDTDTGLLPAINVGRSMALTLQSKLIQTKGRIFFNPTNGLWKTIKTCRNAQIYFDAFIERDDLNNKVKQVVLDALVFEYGIMFVNEETKSLERVKPWEFYVDPAELNYGHISRCYLMHENYPLIALKDKINESHSCWHDLENDRNAKATIYRYFDLKDKKRYLIVNQELIEENNIEYGAMPFVMFYYNDPIKGMYSNSVLDNVYQNQRQIDDILRRIHEALAFNPANTIFVPKSPTNENLSKMMTNKIGAVVPYDGSVGQIVVATPPAIDGQYQQMVEFFERKSFEQEGISQLSAQAKKPSGINSGVALDTLQDVESERFQTQVDNLIQFYKNIYTKMIECFPEGDDILPKRVNRANIKWAEIKKQRDAFSMQSSLASVLSKDPKVKMEQVEKLQQQGIINPYMAASLLQLPDLEGAYSAATASYDCSRKIIERALDEEKYDFYSVVNLKQLLDESVNILLQLDAVDEDPKILDRLVTLIGIVTDKINGVTQAQTPPAPDMPAPVAPPQPPQDTAYAAGQVTALTDIAARIKAGDITPETGKSIIMATFPAVNPQLVLKIVGIPVEDAAQDQILDQQEQAMAQLQANDVQLKQADMQTKTQAVTAPTPEQIQ